MKTNPGYILTAIGQNSLHTEIFPIVAATGRDVIDISEQLSAQALARHLPLAGAVIVDKQAAQLLNIPRAHEHLFFAVPEESEIPWEDVLACHAEHVFLIPAQSAELLQVLAQVPTQASRPASGGRVIAFAGTCGGVGTSTLATVVARHAAAHGSAPVTLVDAVEASGGLDLLTGVEEVPGARWPDLQFNPDGRLDGRALRQALPSDRAGVAVLSAARPTVKDDFRLHRELYDTTVAALAEVGGLVVVDAPPVAQWVDEEPLPLMDHLVVLCTAQVRPVAAAATILKRVEAARIPLSLIVRQRDYSGLSVEDVKVVTSLEALGSIPHVGRLAKESELMGLADPPPRALRMVAAQVLQSVGVLG